MVASEEREWGDGHRALELLDPVMSMGWTGYIIVCVCVCEELPRSCSSMGCSLKDLGVNRPLLYYHVLMIVIFFSTSIPSPLHWMIPFFKKDVRSRFWLW